MQREIAAAVRRGAKADATRSTIIDAALRLFLQNGFDGTTMRAIATDAGVSLGNAYYYFASKEHLIQGFYDRAGAEHRVIAAEIFADTTSFEERLTRVNEAWITAMRPYHAFASSFFRNAADPVSPLSPFSAESAQARALSIAMYEELVVGSDITPPKAARAELPELLWLYLMGIVLFWVHDPSDDCIRSRVLVRRTAPLITRTIQLAKLPVARGMVNDLMELVNDLKTL